MSNGDWKFQDPREPGRYCKVLPLFIETIFTSYWVPGFPIVIVHLFVILSIKWETTSFLKSVYT